jgi:diguanylate cyclase (GGDEF)-like protein
MALMHEEIKAQVLSHEKGDVSIDISIGITSFPTFGMNAEDLLNRADNAMYYAKSHGRGRIQIDEVGLDPQK